jgi:hypothetical protein
MDNNGNLLERIRGEYLEMPGLRLTLTQAARLWGLSPPIAGTLLEALAGDGFLVRAAGGVYYRN